MGIIDEAYIGVPYEKEIADILGVEPPDAARIAQHALLRRYPKGSLIFSWGDEPDGIYIILKGFVKAYHPNEDGTDKIFAFMTTGDIFGEMAMFGTHLRSASVYSMDKTETLLLPKRILESLMKTVPALSLKIAEIMSERLRRINEQVILTEENSRTKILSRLLSIAQTCGLSAPALNSVGSRTGSSMGSSTGSRTGGSAAGSTGNSTGSPTGSTAGSAGSYVTIPFRLTHSDLASYSGLARETVTKRLNELVDERIIAVNRHRRLRLDVESLKRELGGFNC